MEWKPYELTAHLKGRVWSFDEVLPDGFRFGLNRNGDRDVLDVHSFWYLTRFGERFFEPVSFDAGNLTMSCLTYALESRIITEASITDRGELHLYMPNAFALVVGEAGRFLPDWPFFSRPTWGYRHGDEVLLRCPPGVNRGELTAADTLRYRFQDASVPPDDHRSQTLTATRESMTLQVDCYGEILSEATVPTPPGFCETTVDRAMDCFARSFSPTAEATVCGGESHTLTFLRGDIILLQASTLGAGASRTVRLEGDLFAFKHALLDPFK